MTIFLPSILANHLHVVQTRNANLKMDMQFVLAAKVTLEALQAVVLNVSLVQIALLTKLARIKSVSILAQELVVKMPNVMSEITAQFAVVLQIMLVIHL
jgi:hypothetical protein